MAIDPISSNNPKPTPAGQDVPRTSEEKAKTNVKGAGDDPETKAGELGATQAASSKFTQYSDFIKTHFGNKLGGEIIASLEAKEKKGIELSFKVVKEVALESLKNSNEIVSASTINALNQGVLLEGTLKAVEETYGKDIADKVKVRIDSELKKETTQLNRQIIENIVTNVLKETDENKKIDQNKFKEFSGKLDILEKELLEEIKKKILPKYQDDVNIYKDAQDLWSFNQMRTRLVMGMQRLINDSRARMADDQASEVRSLNEAQVKESIKRHRRNIDPRDTV